MNETDHLFLKYLDHDLHISSYKRLLYKFNKCLLKKTLDFENKISIIIQGPLNNRSIKTIPNYLRYGEVVVSCWDSDDLTLLDPYKDKIKIVVNKYSDVPNTPRKGGTQAPWIYQHFTTLNGIKACSGYFCIKVRSDESYPVLDPLINILEYNRDKKDEQTGLYQYFKIVTSNIYFRFDRENKFHPSDHIIAGQKNRMEDIFTRGLQLCRQKGVSRFPEQLICRAIIETYYDPIKKQTDFLNERESKSLMKKHFDIIRIRDLPNHIWTSSYRKYDPLYNEEGWCNHIDLI